MSCRTAMLGLVAVVVIASSAGICSAKPGPLWHELESRSYSFEDFKEDYSKSYASAEEEAQRKSAFEENLARIVAHNRDTSKTWRMGVNHMADKPRHELIASQHGYHKGHAYMRRSGALSSSGSRPWESVLTTPSTKALDRFTRMGSSSDDASRKPWLPYEVDWRRDGVVTAVKNQGQCGSCWAFSAAESLESALALATGELYDLSVQEFVTCTSNPHKCGGTGGCAGSVPQLAFDYALDAGLTEEWSYSYRSFRGKEMPKEDCKELMGSNSAVRVAKVVGHYDIPTNDQEALMEAIAFRGPVSISVDASEWHFYEEGVFNGCNQTNPDLNHAVQLVGYGTDPKDGDYWLVRNSWSPVWGERGYIRLHRETTPRCGKDVTPLDGTGCEGGPPVQEVCGTCGILFDNTIPIVAGKEKLSKIKATA